MDAATDGGPSETPKPQVSPSPPSDGPEGPRQAELKQEAETAGMPSENLESDSAAAKEEEPDSAAGKQNCLQQARQARHAKQAVPKEAEPEGMEVEDSKAEPETAKDEEAQPENMEVEDAKADPDAAKEEDEKMDDSKPEEETKMEDVREPETPAVQPPRGELEEDSAPDTRARVGKTVGLHALDSTLNVVTGLDNQLLMSLQDGGMDYLVAGVRTDMGVKRGRYLFEARIVENLKPQMGGNSWRAPQVLRLGVSLAGANSILFDEPDSCFFDSDGFVCGKVRKKVIAPFARIWGKAHTITLVLNLDPELPAANTISLFYNGARGTPPQPLPEHLLGKALFPTISYRNVSVHVNFGPEATCPLPFSCRTLQDAAAEDIEVLEASSTSGEEPAVFFPVGLPDEGLFDWLDLFLTENPSFTEISDRKLLEWAKMSQLWPQKSRPPSNDKPATSFGVPNVDGATVVRFIKSWVPLIKRNLVYMELKGNLSAKDRKEALATFKGRGLKRVALVLMGEPSVEYREYVQRLMKQDKAAEKENAVGRKGSISEEKEQLVELSEEELQMRHRKQAVPDLTDVAAKAAQSFSLPTEEEGFDEIRYLWQPKEVCVECLKRWQHNQKLMMCLDDIRPGEWFKKSWDEWMKAVKAWRQKQDEWVKKVAEEEAKRDEKEAPPKPKASDHEDFDVMGVEDENVDKLEEGHPLYLAFEIEDWMLLSIRFELHLLVHAFIKDAKDPDRTGFPEAHLLFYYGKYFKKSLSTKVYGVNNTTDLIEFVKDTVHLSTDSLEALLPSDTHLAYFVKQTENARRVRERRLNVGDETAGLNFIKAKLMQHTMDKDQKKITPGNKITPGKNLVGQGPTIRPMPVKVLTPSHSSNPTIPKAVNRPQILTPNLGMTKAANAASAASTPAASTSVQAPAAAGSQAQTLLPAPPGIVKQSQNLQSAAVSKAAAATVAGSGKFIPAPRSDMNTNTTGKGPHEPGVVTPRGTAADDGRRKWGPVKSGGHQLPEPPQRHGSVAREKSWGEAARPQQTDGPRKVPPPPEKPESQQTWGRKSVAQRPNGKRPRSWEGSGSDKDTSRNQGKPQPWVKDSSRSGNATSSSSNTGTTKRFGVSSKWVSQASVKQRASGNVRGDKERNDTKHSNRQSSRYESRGREGTREQSSSGRWQDSGSKDSHKQSYSGRSYGDKSYGDKGGHAKSSGRNDRSYGDKSYGDKGNQSTHGKGNQSTHGHAGHQGGSSANRGSGGSAIGHPGSRRNHGDRGGGRSWR